MRSLFVLKKQVVVHKKAIALFLSQWLFLLLPRGVVAPKHGAVSFLFS